MSIFNKIIEAYPELAENELKAFEKVVILQDDADGKGVYLAHWNYEKPLPEGLSLGKPTA
jgi:hypothetical protein